MGAGTGFSQTTNAAADELTADELAAIQGANNPDAGNVFATMDDLAALGLTSITYANLLTLYNAGTMTPGFYKITDRADQGIIIQAISASQLSLSATALFLVPDFQGVGTYTGVVGLTGVAYGTTEGVWYAANEGVGIVDGVVVFYDGLHYQCIDDGAFDGQPPSSNVTAYEVLPKATANVGYIVDPQSIQYNFSTDDILSGFDKRNNTVYYYSGATGFQWGNDSVRGVTIDTEVDIDSINQRGTIRNLRFSGPDTYPIFGNDFTGSVTGGNYSSINDGLGVNIRFWADANLSSCVAVVKNHTAFLAGTSFNNNIINGLESNFAKTIDVTGVATIAFLSQDNYIGIVKLTGGATESITGFSAFPVNQPIQFRPDDGVEVTFVHATGANQPICAGGVNAVINGSNGDWIEFTRKETYIGSSIFRIYQTGGETY